MLWVPFLLSVFHIRISGRHWKHRSFPSNLPWFTIAQVGLAVFINNPAINMLHMSPMWSKTVGRKQVISSQTCLEVAFPVCVCVTGAGCQEHAHREHVRLMKTWVSYVPWVQSLFVFFVLSLSCLFQKLPLWRWLSMLFHLPIFSYSFGFWMAFHSRHHPLCVYIYIYIHMHTCTHAYTHTWIPEYLHTCIHAFIHAYMHLNIHTFIHSYMHAYIGSYSRTVIRTYVRTHVRK